ISAVLLGLGLPYVEGYKPASNLQGLLAKEVEAYLERNWAALQPAFAAPLAELAKERKADDLDFDRIKVDPPNRLLMPRPPSSPWKSRRAVKVDLAEAEAANRQLGKLGEELVVRLEQKRLRAANRDDLAAKVEWVAETVGDGLGYDVLSFEALEGGAAEDLMRPSDRRHSSRLRAAAGAGAARRGVSTAAGTGAGGVPRSKS